jgi:hypothetical protein
MPEKLQKRQRKTQNLLTEIEPAPEAKAVRQQPKKKPKKKRN